MAPSMPSDLPAPDDHDGAPSSPPTTPPTSPARSTPPAASPPPPPAPNLLKGPEEAAQDAGYPPDPPETTPHRLPLRSLLGGLSPQAVWGILPAAIVLRDMAGLSVLALVVIGLLLVQAARLVAWSRFHWGFDGHVVRISSGVLWRRLRALDVERIQQVDVQRPLLHQVMGTAVLKVETASEGGETEVRLDGLDNDTATILQAAILAARRRERGAAADDADAAIPGPDDPGRAAPGTPATAVAGARSPAAAHGPPVTILRPGIPDLVRSALTGSSLLVVPLSVLALGEFAFDIFGNDLDEVASEAARAGARLGYVTLALIVLVVGVIGAVITILLRDWDIELVREGDDLRLSRGLLTKHAATIPLHRLQVVQYRQNWLRRAMGAGTLVLRSAGGGNPQDTTSTVSIPWVTQAQLPDVLAQVLATSVRTRDDLPDDLQAHPPAARRRLVWRWLRGLGLVWLGALAAGVVAGVDTTVGWGALVGGGLLVVGGGAWALGTAQYERLGHALTPRVVRVAGGVIGATSDWMPLGRLQGVQGVANVFQRRLDLASVQLSPAGRGNTPVTITDVATDTASRLAEDFTLVAAGRVPRSPVARVDAPPSTGSSPATA